MEKITLGLGLKSRLSPSASFSILHSPQYFNWFIVLALYVRIAKVLLGATEWQSKSKRYVV